MNEIETVLISWEQADVQTAPKPESIGIEVAVRVYSIAIVVAVRWPCYP